MAMRPYEIYRARRRAEAEGAPEAERCRRTLVGLGLHPADDEEPRTFPDGSVLRPSEDRKRWIVDRPAGSPRARG